MDGSDSYLLPKHTEDLSLCLYPVVPLVVVRDGICRKRFRGERTLRKEDKSVFHKVIYMFILLDFTIVLREVKTVVMTVDVNKGRNASVDFRHWDLPPPSHQPLHSL